MNPLKKVIVDQLLERVNASPFVLVVDYGGMTVPQLSELREKLAEGQSEMHVAKNTFMRTALKQSGAPDISEHLNGQTAFITGESDVCAAAKAVKDFAKKSKLAEFKSGVLDGKVLEVSEIEALADLPSREVLLATLLGVINQPAAKLVRTINEPGSSLARVLAAKNEG